MRDILSDLEAGKQLSDENPIVRAQKADAGATAEALLLKKRKWPKARAVSLGPSGRTPGQDTGAQPSVVAHPRGGSDRGR